MSSEAKKLRCSENTAYHATTIRHQNYQQHYTQHLIIASQLFSIYE